MKEEYPLIEEETGCMTAAEPSIDCANVEAFPYLNEQSLFDYPEDYDPGIGPYSMDELNARIDKAEQDIDNPEKWIRVDDFWASMKRKHLWLR